MCSIAIIGSSHVSRMTELLEKRPLFDKHNVSLFGIGGETARRQTRPKNEIFMDVIAMFRPDHSTWRE